MVVFVSALNDLPINCPYELFCLCSAHHNIAIVVFLRCKGVL